LWPLRTRASWSTSRSLSNPRLKRRSRSHSASAGCGVGAQPRQLAAGFTCRPRAGRLSIVSCACMQGAVSDGRRSLFKLCRRPIDRRRTHRLRYRPVDAVSPPWVRFALRLLTLSRVPASNCLDAPPKLRVGSDKARGYRLARCNRRRDHPCLAPAGVGARWLALAMRSLQLNAGSVSQTGRCLRASSADLFQRKGGSCDREDQRYG